MPLAGTNFKLRSDTERDTYHEFQVTTAADKVSGVMEKIEDTVGVFVSTSSSGDINTFVYKASKIVVPCVAIPSGSTADYTQGSKVYFDSGNLEVTATSGGNTLCGIITVAGSVADEEIEIDLDGTLGIVA